MLQFLSAFGRHFPAFGVRDTFSLKSVSTPDVWCFLYFFLLWRVTWRHLYFQVGSFFGVRFIKRVSIVNYVQNAKRKKANLCFSLRSKFSDSLKFQGWKRLEEEEFAEDVLLQSIKRLSYFMQKLLDNWQRLFLETIFLGEII